MSFCETRESGVLLIGHGTRDPLGTQEFLQIGQSLADRCGDVCVEPALLEFQSPTIPDAWRSLVHRGVTHIRVAPLLLFAAGHAKNDIPDIIRQCQADSRRDDLLEITVDQSSPLSRHPAIIQLVTRRISETHHNHPSDLARTAIVMVGRGSHDPCAGADMRVLSEIVRHRMDLPTVAVAFYAMASPRLPAVLTDIATSGDYDTVVVYPPLSN